MWDQIIHKYKIYMGSIQYIWDECIHLLLYAFCFKR